MNWTGRQRTFGRGSDSVLVFIKTYANLRSVIGGEILTLRLQGSPTVGEVLNWLAERYGEQAKKQTSGIGSSFFSTAEI
jgi:hypothetical protein